ncbi:MAG: class I SAM-dependent methyltransferase [archaeon]|nr:class I SAM-dependent methyltransferase [archaeon]
MSDTHPFVGQGTSYADSLRFWDMYSEQYSGMQQGDIPERVVRRLLEVGAMTPDDEVLEIGSGPGTYSLRIAPEVRELTCLDTSPRMLDRLFGRAGEMGLDNIRRLDMDWRDYDDPGSKDLCIATLCPGSGSPESIGRMESTSRRSCALVSWVMNHGDDLNAMIWQYLGKDYGYGFRSSTAVQDWLRDNGREPEVEFLKTTIDADIPVQNLIAKEESAFRAHGIDAPIGDIVRDILKDELDGDILHYHAVNEMKLIYWFPGQ